MHGAYTLTGGTTYYASSAVSTEITLVTDTHKSFWSHVRIADWATHFEKD